MTADQDGTAELKVVFDTSALFTRSASNLFSHEVEEVVKANSEHADVLITWYLPEIVRHEREYQMRKKGLELLPSIQKLEKLIGHGLGITERTIEHSVHDTIEEQLQHYNVQVSCLAVQEVDWNRIVLDAVYRRPPFDPGLKEKGFRDAMVGETFLQIVKSCAAESSRVALVTADKLLGDAVKDRTASYANVRILKTLEQLKSLINTLTGEIEEEYVTKIQERARDYFFQRGNKETLYYEEDVRLRIRERFGDGLSAVPEGADRRQNGSWVVGPPRFAKKEGERVHWITRITVKASAYKYRVQEPVIGLGGGTLIYPMDFSALGSGSQGQPTLEGPKEGFSFVPSVSSSQYATLSPLPEPEVLFANGETIVEVTWSVAVDANHQFSIARIEGFLFIGTSWQ